MFSPKLPQFRNQSIYIKKKSQKGSCWFVRGTNGVKSGRVPHLVKIIRESKEMYYICIGVK